MSPNVLSQRLFHKQLLHIILNVNFNDYQGFKNPLCFPQILKFRKHAGKPWAAGFDIELLKDFYFFQGLLFYYVSWPFMRDMIECIF